MTLSLTRTHHVVVAAVDLLYEGAGKALDTVTARLIRDRIGDWIWARARARVLGSGVAKPPALSMGSPLSPRTNPNPSPNPNPDPGPDPKTLNE